MELKQEIAHRMSLVATKANLDLIIALRELGDYGRDATKKLERIVRLDHVVLSPHAAAALLKVNEHNDVANDYLTLQLRSDEPERIWRSAYAVGISGRVKANTIPLLERNLSHPDVRVRTLCACALLKSEPPNHDSDRCHATLAGALCVRDQATPTEFVYPSDSGPSHRLIALSGIGSADDKIAIYWGPLLAVLTAENRTDTQTSILLRVKTLKILSEQKQIPMYVLFTLSTMASNPEKLGMRQLDGTSQELLMKIIE
ncbi:MAG: hypothetical protein R3C53_19310 [Pirellulaceae bacterium]